jgi:hypothetical protein
VNCLGPSARQARDDVLDRDWSASPDESPQDEPEKGLLPSGPAGGLPLKRLEGP